MNFILYILFLYCEIFFDFLISGIEWSKVILFLLGKFMVLKSLKSESEWKILNELRELCSCWGYYLGIICMKKKDEDLSNHEWVQHYYNIYVKKHNFAPKETENMRIQDQCAEGILWQNGEHKHIWSKKELVDTMKEIGYINVKEKKYQESGLPEFQNIDTVGQVRAFHSAVIEANRPW